MALRRLGPVAPRRGRPTKAANIAASLRGTVVELEVTGLSSRGHGVARHGGKIYFVDGALPGERCNAEPIVEKKSFTETRMVQLLGEPSPDRAASACKYYGTCGGCQLQHLSLEAQRNWKRTHVADAWRRIVLAGQSRADTEAFERFVSPCVGGAGYGYRGKLAPRWRGGKLGFLEKPKSGTDGFFVGPGEGFGDDRGGLGVVDVERCAIASDPVNAALAGMRKSGLRGHKKARGANLYKDGEHDVAAVLREACGGAVSMDPGAVVRQRVGGCEFDHDAGGFFQVNAEVTALLVDHVIKKCGSLKNVIDVFCGVGLFAITLAKGSNRKCFGTECSADAIAHARKNAALNDVDASFVACDAALTFKALKRTFEKAPLDADDTVVVADPPREGLDSAFLSALLAFGPRRIVYVSCDAAKQARDASIILADERYTLIDIVPFDMFPQTRHIESCATFQRVEDRNDESIRKSADGNEATPEGA
ncbi:S-adenosyl-L-methionine-dependent methyltransferase [Pelagophyceae sp. CCMP2097]|nr:S-adenosyl-L-methionine-dependent methyltransferase [Pelagophyceae sp. CCMP2097]|mmetsp:Transcript_27052/g.93398  ORF Transcript_27052/g.93398 Transcript_27052/m.93398 type:complete len:479 (-) Transcript_27052:30-1466(-)